MLVGAFQNRNLLVNPIARTPVWSQEQKGLEIDFYREMRKEMSFSEESEDYCYAQNYITETRSCHVKRATKLSQYTDSMGGLEDMGPRLGITAKDAQD